MIDVTIVVHSRDAPTGGSHGAKEGSDDRYGCFVFLGRNALSETRCTLAGASRQDL